MSILQRLVIGFLVLLGLFGVNLWVSFASDDERNAAFVELENALRSQLSIQELQNSLSDRRGQIRAFRALAAAETGPSLDLDELEQLESRVESFTTTARLLRSRGRGEDQATARLTALAERLSAEWKAYFRRLAGLDTDQAETESEGPEERMDRLAEETEALLGRLETRGARRVDAASEAFAEVQAETRQVTGTIFALTSLLSIVVAIALAAYITRRVRRLESGAERIGEGDLEHRIEITSRDELGRLAESFNQMAEKLRIALAQEEEARLEAESHSRAKSAFLANMSHELKTPMNAIIGYTEMLMENAGEDGDEDEAERYLPDLRKIRASSDHLLALINDVLDLSKIEAGKITLYVEEIFVNELLSEVAATAEPLMKENGNTFALETDRDDMGSFHADHTKVRQALFNLLSNAAKFTREGSVTLLAERRPAERRPAERRAVAGDAAGRVLFHVRDTGIGMSDEQVEKIFDEFTQADASTTRKYGGTGLGLSISRRFCRLMGGDLRVESEEGVGSTFTIELPEKVEATET